MSSSLLVQRKITATGGDRARESIDEAATRGLQTPGRALPHGDRIAASFGRFGDAGIVAHTGAEAAASAAAMGAEAYAANGHVVLGDDASLHTVAHEAAHVVQQRAGIACKADLPGDSFEQHADAVADRVVRGESAEDLLAEVAGAGASAAPATGTVQRKIVHGGKALPNTWLQMESDAPSAVKAANAVLDDARAKIKNVDEAKLKKAWSNVSKATKSFDLATDADKLAAEIAASYERSLKASAKAADRKVGYDSITEQICDDNPDTFDVRSGGRNPQIRMTEMADFTDEVRPFPEYQQQKHIGTVVRELYPGGQEGQASFAKDGSNVMISTNTNATNKDLAERMEDVEGILDAAAEVAIGEGVQKMARKEAMKNRVVRHSMKLIHRKKKHLKKDATVTVPPPVDRKIEGRHAELRITEDPSWSEDTHHLPSGTMLPCFGCFLKSTEDEHPFGTQCGPGWLTDAAMSTQMEPQLLANKKLANIEDPDAQIVGKKLADQYENARGQVDFEMGETVEADGKRTVAHQPDSDSELDDSEYEETLKEVNKRGKRKGSDLEAATKKKQKES